MDPKTLSGLDPKLRETYEKVMGTATPSSSSPTPPVPNTPTNPMPTFDAMPTPAETPPLATTIPIPPPSNTSETVNEPMLQSTLTSASSLPQTPQTLEPLPSPAQVNQLPSSTNSTSPIIRILYIVAGIIFFAVYVVFWLKVFKFPLPFLPF